MLRPPSRWKSSPAMAGAPPGLRPWLADPGSLTARIVARCAQFSVRVVRESHARPHRDECALIDVPAQRHAWVREVLLVADGRPVVFAHSVLALPDLTGAWHMARAIGTRPLGAALFADPTICRGPLDAACIPPGHPLHRAATVATAATDLPPFPPLWARRSRFCRAGRPLLVTEVFLPDILDLPA